MDPNGLPFDTERMIAGLRPWIECESPTWDKAAVERMLDLAAAELAAMGASVHAIEGTGGFAGCRVATLPHPKPGPGVLVMGHLDTVHPVGTLEALPFRREGEKVYGPGIQDMKGGIYAAFEALRQLAAAAITTSLPVTVLLTPDEEVGSPSTRDVIEAEAGKHRIVLIPEPAQSDGGVTTGRYAIARFNLRASGRPSHAGARLAEGRSAIKEMARQILAIEAMTTADCTFSVGVVHGGRWVNCVSTTCEGEALSMAKRQPDLDRGIERMLALTHQTDGIAFEVTRGVTRPVWEPGPATMALYERAQEIAGGMGFELKHGSAGGGSDGNFTGAMGIPTLDGLGVEGAGLHTLGEHILAPSLARRGRLLAGLLATAA
jgi:glutamate carboxypeptidase